MWATVAKTNPHLWKKNVIVKTQLNRFISKFYTMKQKKVFFRWAKLTTIVNSIIRKRHLKTLKQIFKTWKDIRACYMKLEKIFSRRGGYDDYDYHSETFIPKCFGNHNRSEKCGWGIQRAGRSDFCGPQCAHSVVLTIQRTWKRFRNFPPKMGNLRITDRWYAMRPEYNSLFYAKKLLWKERNIDKYLWTAIESFIEFRTWVLPDKRIPWRTNDDLWFPNKEDTISAYDLIGIKPHWEKITDCYGNKYYFNKHFKRKKTI